MDRRPGVWQSADWSSDLIRCLAERLPGYLDEFRPDIVLYDGGVDVHGDDSLGRLAMTDDGEAASICGCDGVGQAQKID